MEVRKLDPCAKTLSFPEKWQLRQTAQHSVWPLERSSKYDTVGCSYFAIKDCSKWKWTASLNLNAINNSTFGCYCPFMAAGDSLCPFESLIWSILGTRTAAANEIQVGTLISEQAQRPQGIESPVIIAGERPHGGWCSTHDALGRMLHWTSKLETQITFIFSGQQPCVAANIIG